MRFRSVTVSVRSIMLLAMLLPLVSASVVSAGPPVPPFAQFRVQVNRSRATQDGVLLPSPPREYKQALSRAKSSIDDGEFSDAIDALVEILGRPDTEDYFIDTEKEETQQSLKSAARALLGSLPKAGRDIYELQYGVEARQLLEQAVAARDIEKLTDVSRRFFHTQAGYDATFLLGQHLLDRRRPLAAAMTLARLLDYPAAHSRYGPELSVLLSMSWQLSANPENARRTLLELKRRDPNATLRIGTNDVPLFGENVDPLVWLEQIIGSQPENRTSYVDEWALFRGDPNRNSASRGGMPLPGIQWRVDVCPESVEDEAQVRRMWKQHVDQELPLIPALHPLAVGDYVLMRTVDGLFGVDIDTGKRIWPFPWYQEDESLVTFDSGTDPRGGSSQQLAQRQQRLQQRIWHDLPQGQLSSDGQLVFAVHGTGTPSRVAQRFNAFGARPFGNPVTSSLPGNQLVALELATQGKIRWLLGGVDGDMPELKEVFFLGPPLPLSGRLYVVVELKDEIKLLVLDAEKGTVLWSQQLAHVESPYLSALASVRRLSGASPSFGDGVLVCPTAAGAAVAVDLATRSLIWGYKYPQNSVSSRVSGNVIVRSRATKRANLGAGWADGSVTIKDGRVLLTPLEANALICLDLLTGKPAWKAIPRGDGVYVAGVEQGVVVLVDKQQVRGIRLSDGTTAWEDSLTIPGGAMPSGRGFISGGDYFLPTTADQIVRFRMVDGAIVEVVDSEYPLGNLICYRDKILSQTPDALYVFYQRERMRELMPQRLAENPNDPRTLEDYARLLADDGEWDQAAAHLRRALDLYAPTSSHRDRAQTLLVNVLLSQMRQNFDQAQDFRAELERIVVEPRQRVELFRVLATGLQERNRIVEAFDAYLELASLEPGELPADVDDMSNLERVDENRRVQLDFWLRSQIRALWQAADSAQRELMTARVTELASEVRKSSDRDVSKRFVELFFAFPQAELLVPDLARDAVKAGDFLSAERWLTFLQESRDPQQAATATANLAELYKSRHRYEDVYDQLLRLRDKWPERMIDEELSGRDLAEQGLADLRAGAELGIGDFGPGQLQRWPAGRVTSSATLPQRRTALPDRLSVDLREVHGQWNDEYRLAFDRQRYELVILDSHGADKIAIPCQGRHRTTFYSGHHNVIYAKTFGSLLVVSLGYEIIAVNLIDDVRRSEDRILWRVELVPGEITSPFLASKTTSVNNPWTVERFVPTDKQGRRVGILGPVHASGVCYQKNGELRCVDPLSGHIRWVKRGLPHGCDLFGDEERIFVVPPGSEEAMLLAMSDGRSIGQRPVPPEDRRWRTRGSRILTWDGRHGRSEPLTLRMYDAEEKTDVWSREYADLSRGFLLGVDELVIMQPDGKLNLLELASGDLVLEAQLKPEKQLSQVLAIRSRDQYLFITDQPIQRQRVTRGRGRITSQPRNVVSPGPLRQVNGRIYAYDRVTKDSMWSAPAEIADFSLPLGQAVNSPVLTFVRYIRKQETRNNRTTPKQLTELLCLDRRDGRLLARTDAIAGHQPLQRIEADPAEKRVIIELRSQKGLVLDFSDEPRPPAAPLQSLFRRLPAVGDRAVVNNGLPGILPPRMPEELGLTDLATQISENPFK